MSDDPRGTASQHTTRQEIQKAPRTVCDRCGFNGVSAMVSGGRCVNERACAKRVKITEARQSQHRAGKKP